jgi:transcriptional regulator with AAA-type ATPase domain
MALLSPSERAFAGSVTAVSYCNPFLPERMELEQQALGEQFVATDVVWSRHLDWERERANVQLLGRRATALAEACRAKLEAGMKGSSAEIGLYEDLVNYVLYDRHRDSCFQPLVLLENPQDSSSGKGWKKFWSDYRSFLAPAGREPREEDAAFLFAGYFQIRRAFHHIYHHIIGGSLPAARLRAAVWQSVFTHDMRRYRRSLVGRMADFTTLIVGPTGTGKELVARAIGHSGFIPFDFHRQRFECGSELFRAVTLSALSPTLIESELFGHRRGSFTGAVADWAGWLEVCPLRGAIFLDEIGELDPAIQVKLLRVLQTRTFQRLGETADRRFQGKIIAATNRDLAERIQNGAFREDFYYRLCSDIVRTPSLREQLADFPADLTNLVSFLCARVAGASGEEIAPEVVRWISSHLPPDYPWPGNIRELEQCVRSVLIRGEYQPPRTEPAIAGSSVEELSARITQGNLTAEDLLCRYCALLYSRTGNYEEAARRLGLDRRTVREKVRKVLG